ncbi:hypothetical protein DPM19_10845 [Actinomadura craniellae]|uniref:Uncharacterized protein n=1 Tax=Actinomadura craniellae TaxID=2231787 RepID=A0A365H855_9ACTN|nr:hypothetical protein [Actinomadura craniellae]RAY15208.1 hypothetical protein DPM19_10845 [Actinomadura craniellae]
MTTRHTHTVHTVRPDALAPIVPGDLLARHQTITGLRALADFLETHPAVPVEEYGRDYPIYTDRDHTEESGRAEIDRIAALLGAQVIDDTADGGHYTTSRTFGRITYRAVHIPDHSGARYAALMTYADNVTPDTTPTTTPAADTTHDPAA